MNAYFYKHLLLYDYMWLLARIAYQLMTWKTMDLSHLSVPIFCSQIHRKLTRGNKGKKSVTPVINDKRIMLRMKDANL